MESYVNYDCLCVDLSPGSFVCCFRLILGVLSHVSNSKKKSEIEEVARLKNDSTKYGWILNKKLEF